MTQFTFISKAALLCAVLHATFHATSAAAISDEQARRIHDRLTGVAPSAAVLSTMQGQNFIDAANTAMANPAFYNAKLKNWATPWTNRDDDAFAPLNDFTATVIGLINDGADFREVLYGDVIYVGAGVSGLPAYSVSNNNHYQFLEQNNIDLGGPASKLVRTTQSSTTGLAAGATAGVMTSRGASRAFFIDGTNRAMFRFMLKNMLCHDLEEVHDTSRPADRIRQDITRSPGNDSRIFLNSCVGCHSGMDPMAQAFAHYDYEYKISGGGDVEAGRLVYDATQVHPKYFHDEQNFKPGFRTPNDSWTNNWRLGPNAAVFGWSGAAGADGLVHGTGAKSMGQELANSDAFAVCQVEKVFKAVCLRDPANSDHAANANGVGFDGMLNNFKAGGNLKNTFAEAAAYCADN
ncbi:MAG: hypothetical protein ABW049_09805 [Spongiibacteraceae bacterium]